MAYKCKLLEPDWNHQCDACGVSPIIPETGMCGPCTFGEAETLNGNWESIIDERCSDCDCEEIKESQ